MIIFKTAIKVNGVTPKQITDFFMNMNTKRYMEWHEGHIAWDVLEYDNKKLPKRIDMEERFHGLHMKQHFEIIKYVPNKLILVNVKHHRPVESLLSLSFAKKGNGTIVTQKITFTAGRIIDWIITKTGLFNNFRKFSSEHAKEEFKNLEKILGKK